MTDNYQTHLDAEYDNTLTKYLYYNYYKKMIKGLEEHDLKSGKETIDILVSHFNNGVFRAFLKDYLEWKDLPFRIPKKKGRTPVKIREYIPPSDIKKLRKYFFSKHHDKKFYLMLRLSYECALRRKEVVSINLFDFNFDKWKENDRKDFCELVIKGKGDKERQTAVSPALTQLVLNYAKQHKQRILSKNNLLFGITSSRWQQVFHNAVNELTTKKYNLHGLRFSRATYWHRVKGFDLVTIKKLLGHASISTTQLYIDPEMESALEKLKGKDI